MSDLNPNSGEELHRRRKKRSKPTRPDGASRPRKPDPAAPKITRPCSECGKRFWSWKALFGHMRCHPERQWRGINPPPNHRRDLPSPPLSGEDRDGAASLLMLANGGGIDGHDDQVETDGGDRGLGRYWALDLNFPPAQQYDTTGLTLDLRLGL